MVVPAIGEVVIVPFPFSDLQHSKVRPAVVLADVGRGDWMLCQITSNRYGDPSAIGLGPADFAAGGLHVASYARPGKPFTANSKLFIRAVGKLHHAPFAHLLDSVVNLLRPPAPPGAGSLASGS